MKDELYGMVRYITMCRIALIKRRNGDYISFQHAKWNLSFPMYNKTYV